MRKGNQNFKSPVLPQTDACGSTYNMLAFFIHRLKQHYQFYTLGFFKKKKKTLLGKVLLNNIKRYC
jgi:hypothetical protein